MTDNSTPFWFNIHAGDLGHTLIFGPTGAGKSTLLAFIAAQFRCYENARIFAFDKGMSLFPLCFGAGGDHYNIAFHCQQAIEKALKGYLLFRTGRHFDGHNLTYLCRQAIQLDSKAFSEYLDESAALNDLYIETRYPTDLPFEIDELEVRRYLDMAERMFAAIRQQLYEGGRPHEIVQRR